MKKVMKMIGIIFLTIIVLIAVLLFWNAHRQLLPDDYPKKIKTGGVIEQKYAQYGSYAVSYFEQDVPENYKKYEIWYPSEMLESNNTYPVIVINNGTGIHASRTKASYNRLASWGFIVIANEEEYSWNGFAADMSLQYLLRANAQEDSIFYQHIDTENIGVTGHSQGGVACINTVTETRHAEMYKAAFLVSPTVEELAAGLEWDYDISKVTIPCAIIAGTGDADAQMIAPLEGMIKMYEHAVSSPMVLIARKTGYDHGETCMQTDGYMTAWFMWYLKGDTEAAKAFSGNSPEILENPLYQDQQISINYNGQ
ncbi:MAG: hypothetical protein ACI4R6_04015 [Lachnospiraceae bacterium]